MGLQFSQSYASFYQKANQRLIHWKICYSRIKREKVRKGGVRSKVSKTVSETERDLEKDTHTNINEYMRNGI